jgi:homogentisate 1,2-dioxygenase
MEAPECTPNWVSDFEDQSKEFVVTPNQLRWQGETEPYKGTFLEGVQTMMGAGSPGLKNGLAISIYNFTSSMTS